VGLGWGILIIIIHSNSQNEENTVNYLHLDSDFIVQRVGVVVPKEYRSLAAFAFSVVRYP